MLNIDATETDWVSLAGSGSSSWFRRADWVWLARWLVGCLASWLVGWLAGWLAGYLAGWLVGWLAD